MSIFIIVVYYIFKSVYYNLTLSFYIVSITESKYERKKSDTGKSLDSAQYNSVSTTARDAQVSLKKKLNFFLICVNLFEIVRLYVFRYKINIQMHENVAGLSSSPLANTNRRLLLRNRL